MTTEHPKVIADISMSLDGYVTSEGGLADLAQTSLFPSSTVAPIARGFHGGTDSGVR